MCSRSVCSDNLVRRKCSLQPGGGGQPGNCPPSEKISWLRPTPFEIELPQTTCHPQNQSDNVCVTSTWGHQNKQSASASARTWPTNTAGVPCIRDCTSGLTISRYTLNVTIINHSSFTSQQSWSELLFRGLSQQLVDLSGHEDLELQLTFLAFSSLVSNLSKRQPMLTASGASTKMLKRIRLEFLKPAQQLFGWLKTVLV